MFAASVTGTAMFNIFSAIFRLLNNRRSERRLECSLHAVVTLSNGYRVPAQVVDLSRGGYRLQPRRPVAFPGSKRVLIEIANYDWAQHSQVRLNLSARLLRRIDGCWAGDFHIPLNDYEMQALFNAA